MGSRRRIGLLLNPVAGIGGTVGLKGSDGEEIQRKAFERGAVCRVSERTQRALSEILCMKDRITIYAAPAAMGSNLAKEMGFDTVTVGEAGTVTTAEDTERIAALLSECSIELLLFAGGDGTARNIYSAVPSQLPVIGIPAGVKIHSAVYALSPPAAGRALKAALLSSFRIREAEVMDIDEELYRQGILKAKLYGYLTVPVVHGTMQKPKAASHNSENDIAGICEEIKERMRSRGEDICYILGAGSTVFAVKKSLGFKGTLIGLDLYQNGQVISEDVTEKELLKITGERECCLIITAIGGQGHIFGRGNQQVSPAVLRQIARENIWIVAAASKIYSLPEQSLYVDTGDEAADERLRGYWKVIVGWQESLVCRVL